MVYQDILNKVGAIDAIVACLRRLGVLAEDARRK
jgi:hypothetical protein